MAGRSLKPEKLMEMFQDLAARTGVKIIQDRGDFQGGSCILHEEKVIVVNKRKPLAQQVRVLAQGFAELDLSGIYLVPALRAYIDEIQGTLIRNEKG
jgi:hypothetical protein